MQNLTTSQLQYLRCIRLLAETGTVRATDISRQIGFSMPSVHHMLVTLEALGMITKSRYTKKDSIFKKWCWSNRIFISKKRNFNLNLTSNTKINLKRITGFSVKYETIKLLEDNIRKKSSGPKPWAIALRQVTKSRSHKK